MARKGQKSPRTVTIGLRPRAWWVMRRRISFTISELMATLCDGTERDANGNLAKWLRALEKAGIVAREEKRQAGNALTSPGMLRYKLVINAGRQAPVWRAKSNTVYDPNTEIIYQLDEVRND